MTAKERYDVLVCKPDLHSFPEVYDNVLIWYLYKDAYIQVCCNNGDIIIEVIGHRVFTNALIRWLSDENEIVDKLYTLEKRATYW